MDMVSGAMDRTVTVTGPDGQPSVTVEFWQALAAAAAGVLLAPKATAAAALAGLFAGVTVSVDQPTAETT